MSIFEAYDSEFSSLTKEVTKNVNEYKYNSAGDKSNVALVKQIDALFSQINDLIKQMEVEVRGLDPSTRKVLTEKVSHYRKSTASLKSDFERAKEQSERSTLIGTKSTEQRQRLLDANDKINRQNELISNAHRTVAETEEVGLEITQELTRNREKIESSRAKAQEFSGLTDGARVLLASMSKRDVRQKFVIFFIAALLIIAIVLTAYYASK